MPTVVNGRSITTLVVRRVLSWLGVAILVSIGLLAPQIAQAALWSVLSGGPHFDHPHNGQVVAHLDVRGRVPVDIARIRLSEASSGATVWDVTPTTARSECWNGCWKLTFKTGSNPASFSAGRQQFNASVPQGASFSLTPGTPYLFEVWGVTGGVGRHRFTL